MLRLLCTVSLILALSGVLQAKQHYINRGTKYHIGDDRASLSTDSDFLDAYPVVGQEWVVDFQVSEADHVKVSIEHVWGVDDCPYCKIIVSIDQTDMGRLTAANNHEPFYTLDPLAKAVKPGVTYRLKIASYAKKDQADDFAIEGVIVETNTAELIVVSGPKYLDAPPPVIVPSRGPCEGTTRLEAWLPFEARSKGVLEMRGGGSGEEQKASLDLKPGDYAQLYVKNGRAASGDRMGQAFEVLLGGEPSGWVFSFPPAGTSPRHGNLKLKGRYSAPTFNVSGWRTGDWNDIRVARCNDGRMRLFLNGTELAQSIEGTSANPQPMRFRSLGLPLQITEKPF